MRVACCAMLLALWTGAGCAAGSYGEAGEILDLLAGIVGWDPAGDDGVAKGDAFEE
jgi:hypothetical protein